MSPLPKYPNVDDVVGLEHTWLRRRHRRAGRGDPDPHEVRHQLNPNFGGEVMVVSALGCR